MNSTLELCVLMLARRRRAHGARGVTLIELLVVIVIIGILAAISVPGYRRYMIRAQRAEAKIALLQLQSAQEKFYLQNNRYTANITGASPAGLGMSDLTETNKYQLTVALAADALGNPNQAYMATATPTASGGQGDDTYCGRFTIDERGTRGNTGSESVQHCWK
jgi:type IV pilus assembly protein PilE